MSALEIGEVLGLALGVGAAATAIFWRVRGRTAGLVSGGLLALVAAGAGGLALRHGVTSETQVTTSPAAVHPWAAADKNGFVTGCERTAPGTMSESCGCFADELEKVAGFEEVSQISDANAAAGKSSPELRARFKAIVESCRARASK